VKKKPKSTGLNQRTGEMLEDPMAVRVLLQTKRPYFKHESKKIIERGNRGIYDVGAS